MQSKFKKLAIPFVLGALSISVYSQASKDNIAAMLSASVAPASTTSTVSETKTSVVQGTPTSSVVEQKVGSVSQKTKVASSASFSDVLPVGSAQTIKELLLAEDKIAVAKAAKAAREAEALTSVAMVKQATADAPSSKRAKVTSDTPAKVEPPRPLLLSISGTRGERRLLVSHSGKSFFLFEGRKEARNGVSLRSISGGCADFSVTTQEMVKKKTETVEHIVNSCFTTQLPNQGGGASSGQSASPLRVGSPLPPAR
jgi:hypothetical protein